MAMIRSRGREFGAKQGFLKYYSAVDRVAANQGWSLRGVPLYITLMCMPTLELMSQDIYFGPKDVCNKGFTVSNITQL